MQWGTARTFSRAKTSALQFVFHVCRINSNVSTAASSCSRLCIKFSYTENVKHILQNEIYCSAKYISIALLLSYIIAEYYEFYGECLWFIIIVAHS